jgi:hypothetical protein
MENATLIDEYGYVKDGKVFLKGYLNYPDRQIGEVKRTEQDAVDYFRNRFVIAEEKVTQLEQQVEEALNKGSYLTKLIQLRKKIIEFDALGDFIPLLERLDEVEVFLSGLIENNQIKNLEIKRALIEDAKVATLIEDWQQATDAVQEVKTKWIRTGPVDKEYQQEVEGKFQEVLDDFFQRRRAYFAHMNSINQERIDACEVIIKQVKSLNYTNDWDEAFLKIRELKKQWRDIGEIPPKKFFKLNKNYHHFLKVFYEKYNAIKGIEVKPKVDPRILEQQKLFEQATALLSREDIISAANEAKVLLSKWKEIKVPFRLADKDLADNFRATCDKIFELSYLARVILRKYPAFQLKSEEEQLRTKIREMEWLAQREKADLEQAIADFENNPTGNELEDKATLGRINIQKRKVGMKERIVREFKQRLEALA